MNRKTNTPELDRRNWCMTIVAFSVIAASIIAMAAAMIPMAAELSRRHPAVLIPAIGALAVLMVGLVAAAVGDGRVLGAACDDYAPLAEEPGWRSGADR